MSEGQLTRLEAATGRVRHGTMCGIVALFSGRRDNQEPRSIGPALQALRHRGPDGSAEAAAGRAQLGHARLAILDVPGGAQPMRGEDRRCALVCNGEIYNHGRLREQLAPAHHLQTRSDSEVVLHLYEERGPQCVYELEGMFAFFASDGERFLAARDALGIKPLYVGWHSGSGDLWFASEFKALLPHCDGFLPLPAGSYLTEAGDVHHWFTPGWAARVGAERPASGLALREKLEAAVSKRLMSDVPVGVFLSGGLDSSIVAALAKRHLSRLSSFAVGLAGAPDLAAARHVARALGTEHQECLYTAEDVSVALRDVIYHLESYDVALIRSAIPCYFLAQLAAESVKVVLTGEGADELFGGYAYFSALREPERFHRECAALLSGLHAMNLQRVDRMTMAHGLEGRVPFLDTEFVDWSMGLDPRLKMWQPETGEKQLLRSAFAGWLPESILARRKLEFAAGSGVEGVLTELAGSSVSDRDLLNAPDRYPIDTPVTKEELLYRRWFEELFPGSWARASVQRWRPSARDEGTLVKAGSGSGVRQPPCV